jgi:hypothetical protein
MNNVLIHTWQAAVGLRVFVIVLHFSAKYTYIIICRRVYYKNLSSIPNENTKQKKNN